jgi:hypothetical protein
MLPDIIATIVLENGAHIQKRFPTFSLAIHGDKWILSSLKMVFEPWWTLSLLI